MKSIGMPEDMISKMRPEQIEQMKRIIEQDPKQQAQGQPNEITDLKSLSLQESVLHFRKTGDIVPRMRPNRRLKGLGKWQE